MQVLNWFSILLTKKLLLYEEKNCFAQKRLFIIAFAPDFHFIVLTKQF
jgi:hypothetical protein